ncbi:Uncharacterized protein dnm_080580 [Desulfonema magnum]|uniref:Uncharacterized protein n=1 Tax=Desulfonema magnum TaxID=45655 RepID=A0A975BUC2_9BACT|nr:Uncharacterized protein dnm_080580 [Desulfonema magnum]
MQTGFIDFICCIDTGSENRRQKNLIVEYQESLISQLGPSQ